MPRLSVFHKHMDFCHIKVMKSHFCVDIRAPDDSRSRLIPILIFWWLDHVNLSSMTNDKCSIRKRTQIYAVQYPKEINCKTLIFFVLITLPLLFTFFDISWMNFSILKSKFWQNRRVSWRNTNIFEISEFKTVIFTLNQLAWPYISKSRPVT